MQAILITCFPWFCPTLYSTKRILRMRDPHSPSAYTARPRIVAVRLADHQLAGGGRERRGVGVDFADVAQQSGALQSALDVGRERGGYDDRLSSVGGDELEEIVHSLNDFDVSETLLDLRPRHANL